MNRYLKLVNFEFNRFLKLYLILMGIVVFFQLVGVVVESRKYVKLVDRAIYEDLMSKSDVLSPFGQMSLERITGTPWFFGPILLSISTLMIYVFFIWYRDWLGKNSFIYRLLMLPTERLNLYLAKATTILLFVLGMVALQLTLITLQGQAMKWLVPDEFRLDFSVKHMTMSNELVIFFPNTFTEFVLYYGGGIIIVCIIFTSILFERSYHLKGILYGILYSAASIFLFMTPILVDSFLLQHYFYPLELLGLQVAMGLLVLVIAIWLGHYLLKNKIRV